MRGIARGTRDAREQCRQHGGWAQSAGQAWNTLDAVHASIDRADTKAAVVLATSGAASAALFSLVATDHTSNTWIITLFAICAANTLAAGLCAGMTLIPRRIRHGAPTSLIYFDHVARAGGPSGDDYTLRAMRLFSNPQALCAAIIDQVWATAKVATAKYSWVNKAMIMMLINLATLGAAAMTVAVA